MFKYEIASRITVNVTLCPPHLYLVRLKIHFKKHRPAKMASGTNHRRVETNPIKLLFTAYLSILFSKKLFRGYWSHLGREEPINHPPYYTYNIIFSLIYRHRWISTSFSVAYLNSPDQGSYFRRLHKSAANRDTPSTPVCPLYAHLFGLRSQPLF